MLDRRRFLSSLATGLAAGVSLPFASCGRAGQTGAALAAAGDDPATGSGSLVGPDGAVDWAAVRGEFRLAPDWIHLGSFFLVSHPRPVREAIAEYRRRLDENPLWLEEALFSSLGGGESQLDRVKQSLAGYMGGRPEEIALTPNTTTGLALVYNGLKIRAGQEIVTTEHDHYVHHESIRRAAEKRGASVRFVPLYDRGAAASEDEIVERVRRALGPETRALGVTWVHSSTGVKLPIPAIAEVVAEANAGRAEEDRCLLVVDGVHGFGVEDVDAACLGADFFVAGTHKWLFAPRGTGLVWAPAERWPQVEPTVPSFDVSSALWTSWVEREPLPPTRASFVSPGGFIAYEHQFAVPDAVEFHQGIGRDRIAGRIHELNGRFREALAEMPGITLHTPVDGRLASGICCFEVDGMETAEVVERLSARRIHATASPYAEPYARVAAGIMNTPEEVETTLAAIRELA
ncbi:MAG: aminotransferase class V-fold PLP-dependent enzyme [Thermoanaerobaculia bacterium]